jgi:hypothetical protein
LGIAACGGDHNGGGNFAGAVAPNPPPPKLPACSQQSIVGIDPVSNIGYVPVFARDGSGNAEVVVVDLTVGAADPVLATLAIPGASRSIGIAYDPIHKTMLDEIELTDGEVGLAVIDTTTKAVSGATVNLAGLTYINYFGGVIEDPVRRQAIVAGTTNLGVLDTSVSPPVWKPASVITTDGTDSIALNLVTGILFISDDGKTQIIDTGKTPYDPLSFDSDFAFGISDGVAFDLATNVMVLTPEGGVDEAWALNFATLNTTATPATADSVRIPGLGEAGPLGEGPGGSVAINCTTHQAVVADEHGGANFKLLQLPVAPVAGALNNNGQPGTATTADGASAYTIAATQIPEGLIDGSPTALEIGADPHSIAIDPARNLLYATARSGNSEFLVQVDLSKPVLGASPTGGVDGSTFWTPTGAAIALP